MLSNADKNLYFMVLYECHRLRHTVNRTCLLESKCAQEELKKDIDIVGNQKDLSKELYNSYQDTFLVQ